MKENAIWWSFKMNDLVKKNKGRKQIEIKKKYTLFTEIMNRPEMEKTV